MRRVRAREVGDVAGAALLAALGLASLALDPGPARLLLTLPLLVLAPGWLLVSALWPARAGPDGVERAALAVGASLALSVLSGLLVVLSPLTYAPASHLALLAAVCAALVVAAVARRRGVPEPYSVAFARPSPAAGGVAVVALVALTALAYVAYAPPMGEPDTELYLLAADGRAAGYPERLAPNATATVLVGIVNHEGRAVEYRLVQRLADAVRDDRTIALSDGERREIPSTFGAPAEPGRHRVEWSLYREGDAQPYRGVHLALNVTTAP